MMPAAETLAAVTSVAAATIGGAQRPGRHAERAGLLLRQRHRVHAPAQRDQHRRAEQNRPEQRHEVGGVVAGEAAEQPEGHGRQLVVGVGEILHEADAGAEQRADDDAGQHQHQDVSPPRSAEPTA